MNCNGPLSFDPAVNEESAISRSGLEISKINSVALCCIMAEGKGKV